MPRSFEQECIERLQDQVTILESRMRTLIADVEGTIHWAEQVGELGKITDLTGIVKSIRAALERAKKELVGG